MTIQQIKDKIDEICCDNGFIKMSIQQVFEEILGWNDVNEIMPEECDDLCILQDETSTVAIKFSNGTIGIARRVRYSDVYEWFVPTPIRQGGWSIISWKRLNYDLDKIFD